MSTISNFIKKINSITSAVRSVTSTVRAVKTLRNEIRGRRPSSAVRSPSSVPGTVAPTIRSKPIGLSQVSSSTSGRNSNPRPVRPATPSPNRSSKIR